jgi:hypothetical protein
MRPPLALPSELAVAQPLVNSAGVGEHCDACSYG